jgi:hypothetical protein
LYYRRDASQIDDVLAWAALFEDHAYRVVKQTKLPGGQKWVSTVWLGLDHNFFSGGAPLIFETMVFGRHDLSHFTLGGVTRSSKRDYGQKRWATEAEAIAGHASLCRFWRLNRARRRQLRP